MPAEDLLVTKALATDEDTARYWYDALAIVARTDLDWSYLSMRARQHGARRILSLLLFATSVDLLVPRQALDDLYDLILDLVVHGHAHAGTEKGATPRGIPVRNVAQPVLRRPYAVYGIDIASRDTGDPPRDRPDRDVRAGASTA